jgi:NTP pyrophosphatase (non-canonical NTP hydrolase)
VSIQEELADVLAYVLKLANYTGIDLEEAYLRKMQLNERREWLAPAATESENS